MMMAAIVCERTSLNVTHIVLNSLQKLCRPCTIHMGCSSHIHTSKVVTRFHFAGSHPKGTHLFLDFPGGKENLVDEFIDILHALASQKKGAGVLRGPCSPDNSPACRSFPGLG